MAHHILTGPINPEFEGGRKWEDLTPQQFFGECYDRCNYDDNFPANDGDTYGRPGLGEEVKNVSRAWCVPGPDADPATMPGDTDDGPEYEF